MTTALEPLPVELIDWSTIHERGDELVEGLVIPGRWTAFAAEAKAGKSTLLLHVTLSLAAGRDPFDRTPCEPVRVLYVDAEMGRVDLDERLRDHGINPPELTNWWATDLSPKLDTIEGGNALIATATALDVVVVALDGINGCVAGAENDDTTWRNLYQHTIAPLKRAGVAVLTVDNTGKDATLGPRGSSVKLDKPDAIIRLQRTDGGVRLVTTHRRSALYPPERSLTVQGVDGDEPITYRATAMSWPAGTAETAALLDELDVPLTDSRRKVQDRLRGINDDRAKVRTNVLGAAIRYRKSSGTTPGTTQIDPSGTTRTPTPRNPENSTGTTDGNQWEPPAPVREPEGVCSVEPPLVHTRPDRSNS